MYSSNGREKVILQDSGYVLIEVEDVDVPYYEQFLVGVDADTFENEARERLFRRFRNSIIRICDRKTIEAKYIISGMEVSEEQLFRYEAKYKLANKYKNETDEERKATLASYLQKEADSLNTDVDSLVNTIILKGDEYYDKIFMYGEIIEAFRHKCFQLMEEYEFDRLTKIIDGARTKKIEELLDEFEEEN